MRDDSRSMGKSKVQEEVYRLLEPRLIATPDGYQSSKIVTGILLSQMSQVHLLSKVGPGDIYDGRHQAAPFLLYNLVQYHVPVFYVADAFAHIALETELPEDLMLQDLKWPFPALVLGFSKEFCKACLPLDVNYIVTGFFNSGQYAPPFLKNTFPVMACTSHQVCFHALCRYLTSSGGFDHLTAKFNGHDMIQRALTYEFTSYIGADPTLELPDKRLLEKIVKLVCAILAILKDRGDFIECGAVQRPVKIKHGRVKKPAIYGPNFLGRSYRDRNPGLGGTHTGPETHWRRAHFTYQVFGHKNENFVSVESLPRRVDGAIDWVIVSEETRQKFWACHRRLWISQTEVNVPEDKSK